MNISKFTIYVTLALLTHLYAHGALANRVTKVYLDLHSAARFTHEFHNEEQTKLFGGTEAVRQQEEALTSALSRILKDGPNPSLPLWFDAVVESADEANYFLLVKKIYLEHFNNDSLKFKETDSAPLSLELTFDRYVKDPETSLWLAGGTYEGKINRDLDRFDPHNLEETIRLLVRRSFLHMPINVTGSACPSMFHLNQFLQSRREK